MQISATTHASGSESLSRTRWLAWYFMAIVALGAVAGCYSAAEVRAKTEAAPDPRAREAEKIWEAMQEVARQRAWKIDLNREEDLFMTTQWAEIEPGLRKRVRLSVVMADRGVGINANVRYERLAEGNEPTWQEASEPDLDAKKRAEEQALVEQIADIWQDR